MTKTTAINPDMMLGAERLLRGLLQELPKAYVDGRLSQWATAAHSIVDLLSQEPVNVR